MYFYLFCLYFARKRWFLFDFIFFYAALHLFLLNQGKLSGLQAASFILWAQQMCYSVLCFCLFTWFKIKAWSFGYTFTFFVIKSLFRCVIIFSHFYVVLFRFCLVFYLYLLLCCFFTLLAQKSERLPAILAYYIVSRETILLIFAILYE